MNEPAVKSVLRRSHMKSRHGCHTCKARRIKCDEFRPHCGNCSRSQRMCKYPTVGASENNIPTLGDKSESHLQIWTSTGQPPFPFLELPITPSWHSLPLTDLRHMHHLALMASILEISKTREFCLYWSEFKTFVQLALGFDFVRYAVIAHSAKRFALVTKTSVAVEDAVRFQKSAIRGLNEAISSFSRDNADAVLCVSLCLSNQQSAWQSWKTMLEGVSTVIQQMRPWVSESLFSRFLHLEPRSRFDQPTTIDNDSPVAAGEDPNADLKIQSLLNLGVSSLNVLSSCTKDRSDLSALTRQLRDACKAVLERPSYWPVAEQFRLIHPFASWMDEYTMSYFSISNRDPVVLASLAHFYAVVVALNLALPEIDLPMVIPIRIESILKIKKLLNGKAAFFCSNCRVDHSADGLMEFPLETVHVFNQTHQTE